MHLKDKATLTAIAYEMQVFLTMQYATNPLKIEYKIRKLELFVL